MNQDSSQCKGCKCSLSFGSGLKAGFLGAIVMTVIVYLMGTDLTKSLGTMIVGEAAGNVKIYVAGGAVHLLIGMIFGAFYAIVIAPMRAMGRLLRAILLATVLTAIAYYAMPMMPKLVDKYMPHENTPAQMVQDANPYGEVANPYGEVANPYGEVANPCNPCSGNAKKAIVKSWINHFIFSLVVVLVYRPKRNYN